jgi:hypothetical protein
MGRRSVRIGGRGSFFDLRREKFGNGNTWEVEMGRILRRILKDALRSGLIGRCSEGVA